MHHYHRVSFSKVDRYDLKGGTVKSINQVLFIYKENESRQALDEYRAGLIGRYGGMNDAVDLVWLEEKRDAEEIARRLAEYEFSGPNHFYEESLLDRFLMRMRERVEGAYARVYWKLWDLRRLRHKKQPSCGSSPFLEDEPWDFGDDDDEEAWLGESTLKKLCENPARRGENQ